MEKKGNELFLRRDNLKRIVFLLRVLQLFFDLNKKKNEDMKGFNTLTYIVKQKKLISVYVVFVDHLNNQFSEHPV